jgi:hypothetical protein
MRTRKEIAKAIISKDEEKILQESEVSQRLIVWIFVIVALIGVAVGLYLFINLIVAAVGFIGSLLVLLGLTN